MKTVFFEAEVWECEAIEKIGAKERILCVREPLNRNNAEEYREMESLSVFIYSELNSALLERFKRLKLIATRSTGYDHIDLEYCRRNGITVCNVPRYGDNTVAEHVFGLLLTISHHIVKAVDRTRKGDFSLQGLRGFDLNGKTLGVVGVGSIGECVIGIANGFGMKVLAFDVHPVRELASRLRFKYTDMDELLSSSHVITFHVPATPKTRHLISYEEFGKMKKGVVLINTSRGSVVDTHALLHALTEGTVSAAGLDVLAGEPTIREEAELASAIFRKQHNLEQLLADHVLLRMQNVFITPHSAFYTHEALLRIFETTVENIDAYISGNPVNVVDK
jgi:D-lactate dehydrogenase